MKEQNVKASRRGIVIVSVFAILAASAAIVMINNRDALQTDIEPSDLYEQLVKKPMVHINYDGDTKTIAINYPSTNVLGIITLYQASDLSREREYSIYVDDAKKQIIETDDLKSGNWRVRVEWFLNELSFYQEKTIAIP